MRLMTRSPRTGSGACSCRPTASSSEFRGHFIGECSPVHFFWGSFDPGGHSLLEVAAAPQHPGGVPHLPDAVTRRSLFARSKQLRFLAGAPAMPKPVFYSHAYRNRAAFPPPK